MKKIFLALATAATAATFALAPSFALAAPAGDPQTVAAVKSMLDAMQVRKSMVAYFGEMEKSMPAMMRQQIEASIKADPSLNAQQKQQALAKLNKALPSMAEAMNKMFRDPTLVDELINEMVPLYASHFTTAEIKELTAFYRTPIGRKTMEVMPKVTAESMQLGQKVVMPRLGKLMQDFKQSMEKQ